MSAARDVAAVGGDYAAAIARLGALHASKRAAFAAHL
jgi:hypothetical protein